MERCLQGIQHWGGRGKVSQADVSVHSEMKLRGGCKSVCAHVSLQDSGGETDARHSATSEQRHAGGCGHEVDSAIFTPPPVCQRSRWCHRDAPANERRRHMAQLDSKAPNTVNLVWWLICVLINSSLAYPNEKQLVTDVAKIKMSWLIGNTMLLFFQNVEWKGKVFPHPVSFVTICTH